LLQNESRRAETKRQLAKIVASLGGPGASRRAARAITKLIKPRIDTDERENRKVPVSSD